MEKLIGCCRDFSLLLCSMLRHKKIPARLRFGFSTFQIPGFHHDQVLVEYWHPEKNNWCLADPRVDDFFIKKYQLRAGYQAHEIPKNAFLTAAEAWKCCRQGIRRPEKFGIGGKKPMTGWWYLRNKLIQDFAALNKVELLLWDAWGMMLNGSSDNFLHDSRQLNLLDFIAELITQPEMDLKKINHVYVTEKDLHVGQQIYCDSYAGEKRFVEMKSVVKVFN